MKVTSNGSRHATLASAFAIGWSLFLLALAFVFNA